MCKCKEFEKLEEQIKCLEGFLKERNEEIEIRDKALKELQSQLEEAQHINECVRRKMDIERDELLAKIAEMSPNKFEKAIEGLTPMEIATKLATSTAYIPGSTVFGVTYGGYEANILCPTELEEISEYLKAYCNYHREE